MAATSPEKGRINMSIYAGKVILVVNVASK
jgi:glutathione peroxidase-family protein